ncbi:MAG: alpha/beta hydrolase [Candidatus Pelagadaptatus aseana]|uniref:alpha/beta fold hydrolase n=1 Tax=Candidatus Pelagadaptatus aseana TaxID=3120508 RepID=UPI0039B14FAB
MKQYQDIYYQNKDGLTLYARDYGAPSDSDLVVLCLHGLTRNSADFEFIAEHLSKRHRVICAEQRGRGLSQWDTDASRYNPQVYVEDMWQLLESISVTQVVVIGTSMGGLMGMMMAATKPENIQGLIINDIGPEVAPEGLARIMGYVGKVKAAHDWSSAIEQTRLLNQSSFPHYSDQQWQKMAERLYRENDQGLPVLAYDPAIAAPIEASQKAAVPPDLWPLFSMLSEVPLMAIRGEYSDILSQACFEKMKTVLPTMQPVEVPGVGHAPMLDEAQSVQAIDAFVNRLCE